jgi:hypothetical protein
MSLVSERSSPVLRDWFNRFAWFWILNSTNRFNREYVFSFDACASILQWRTALFI